MKKILALILCAVLLTACCAAEEETADRILLMSVGGVPVYLDDVDNMAYQLYYYGYIDDYSDYVTALEYRLYFNVAPALIAAPVAEELLGDLYPELVASYGEQFDSYVSQYASELCGDDAALYDAKYAQALEEYAADGVTRESYINECVWADAFTIMMENMKGEVSNEEIEELFAQYVAGDEAYFKDNALMYEYYYAYAGYESYYMPAGYRGILHILVDADDELLSAYENAETEEEKAAAAEAVVESVQGTLDEIYAAFEAGTPFTDLIEKYNTDPGMTDPDNLAKGYSVHKDSILYMEEFTKGAFSEGMEQPGDISQPVVTSYGVHIMYYLRDIPEGAVELTDEMRTELADTISSNDMLAQVAAMLKEYEIVYTDAYKEYIDGTTFLDY